MSWFGSVYRRDAWLAFLDIAVVSRDSENALVLVEIEEAIATPKKLMADVLTTLIADHVTFQSKRELKVGSWTRLVVLSKARKTEARSIRLELLQERLNQIRGQLSAANASLGWVAMDTFQNESDLDAKLSREVEKGLALNPS